MASITIRNLDDGIERRLRTRAAGHDRSLKEEDREILRNVVGAARPRLNLAAIIHARVAQTGCVDLGIAAREPVRDPPALT